MSLRYWQLETIFVYPSGTVAYMPSEWRVSGVCREMAEVWLIRQRLDTKYRVGVELQSQQAHAYTDAAWIGVGS